jgi:hypothetical protein
MINVSINAPFGTVIFDGTLATAGLLLVNDTDAPPPVAGMSRVTVPVPLLPTLITIGLMVKAATSGPVFEAGSVTVMVTVFVVTEWVAEIERAADEQEQMVVVTGKVAVVAPAATRTKGGRAAIP